MTESVFNLRAVEGEEDRFAFTYGFLPEGKSADDQVVTETEDGDLIIEGYAAVFDGVDRTNENFVEGAFQRGIKSFLTRQASLNFHHRYDMGIGKVLDLREVEGKGLWMRARVDYQPESSPLRYIYNGIKKGTYNALSVGGYFNRRLTSRGWRIADMDFTEISVTPVPCHPGTNFAVVAGKALSEMEVPTKPEVEGDEIRSSDREMIQFHLDGLERIFDQLRNRGKGEEEHSDSDEIGL